MAERSYEFGTLLAFALGELDSSVAADLQAAATRDAELSRSIARVRNVLATLRAEGAAAPPAEVIAKAYQIARRETVGAAHETESWLEQLQRIIAALVFDSRATPALAGLRGAGEGFQVAYETETADIDLQVQPNDAVSEGPWVVLGNISNDGDAAPADVALLSIENNTPVATTQADAHGNFRMAAAGGKYNVGIRIGSQVIILPDIQME